MHVGDDTAYYLHRGYRVVSVEANPSLADHGKMRFSQEISDGNLHIINRALSSREDDVLEFYIAEANSEWSSLQKWRVEQTGNAIPVHVKSITLSKIMEEFGVPYYIKCDIEGADADFVEQLSKLPSEELPPFVSVEGIALQWLESLASAGYDRVQLVSQAKIRRGFDPVFKFISSDGVDREWKFLPHSSGKFGHDLELTKWISVPEAIRRWSMFQELKGLDADMTLDNWFDFHVTKSHTIGQ